MTHKSLIRCVILCVPLLLACQSANARFFYFYIAGGGGPDNTCVAETAKEGDTFSSPSGNIAKITKLSGTSSRCTNVKLPILATVDYTSNIRFTSKAGIELPEKYKPITLTDRQHYFTGVLLAAKTDDEKLFVRVYSVKRSIISSMPAFVKKYKERQWGLDESVYSDTAELKVNGLSAWQFEQKGKLKNLFGFRMIILHTIIEAESEVVTLQTSGYENDYTDEKEAFKKLPFAIRGLTPPTSPVVAAPVAQPERPTAQVEDTSASAVTQVQPAVQTTEE